MESHRRSVGQMLPIVAVVLGTLLAAAVLVVDGVSLYWARWRLQHATDAAAIGGATYLTGASLANVAAGCGSSTTAGAAACTYAVNNGVALSEIQSIVLASDGRSITVNTARNVPAALARVLGKSQFTVTAKARAGLMVLNSVEHPIPIGLDAGTPYTYGQPITMHEGPCGPGCWAGLALMSLTQGSTGGAAYRQNLQNGCNCQLSIGDIVSDEPGATSGPTKSGIQARIDAGTAADPSGTWASHSLDDMRAATVPLINWAGCAGRCSVPVMGFAEVWLTGSSGSDVSAIFIRQVVPGTPGSGGSDTGAVHAALLE